MFIWLFSSPMEPLGNLPDGSLGAMGDGLSLCDHYRGLGEVHLCALDVGVCVLISTVI